MPEETLTKNVKKVIHWGKGMAVFITIEAKRFGWTDKDFIVVASVRDGKDEKIVIRKANI